MTVIVPFNRGLILFGSAIMLAGCAGVGALRPTPPPAGVAEAIKPFRWRLVTRMLGLPLEVICAAYESARSGRKVLLPFHTSAQRPIDLRLDHPSA